MTWIKDQNDRLVNINNWDILDCQTITDTKKDLPVVYKITLSRSDEEIILGYTRCENIIFEDVLEQISKGVSIHLETLQSALYYYLDEEFDEEFGQMATGKSWEKDYNKRYEMINKLIGTRFIED